MKPTPELLAYFGENQGKIQAFATLLKTTGIEHGLIGPKEGDRIWERHIANCIPITTIIPQGVRVVDIGSGAGLPGVVIALARPDLKVTLVEPLQRRVDFLNEVVAELALDIEVIRGRAERVKKQFEVVTARAVAPLEKLMEISWHMIPKTGSLMAMKGESAATEMVGIKGAELHEIKLEGIELGRVISVRKGSVISA